MTEAIAVALISSGASLIGVVVTCLVTSRKSREKILEEFHTAKADTEKAQALTDQKVQNLTDEVRMHNNFARRMPVVEEQIKAINHRVEDLERRT